MKTNCLPRVTILLGCFCFYLQGHCQFSASSTLAQTITTASIAQGTDWTNPANVQASDGNFATCLITGSNKPTYYLDAKNWGFQSIDNTLGSYVPPGAVINGIEVYVKLRKTNSGSIKDNKIILLKAGAEAGTSKARGNTLWPSTSTEIKFGSNIDLWGTMWSPSDLTNSGFGIRISAKNRGSKNAQAEIDNIRIVLYFNQSYFYSKSSGNLELLSTWGINTDGSGSSPLSFSTSGQVFFLQNRTSAALTGNLTISGALSKMTIGDGISATTLTVPSSYTLNATVDIAAASALIITNSSNPVIGSIADNTTVTYNASGNQYVQDGIYYNLTLGGSGIKTLQNSTTGSTTVNNVLTIGTGVQFANQGDNVNIYGTATGISNNGTASGAGRFIYSLLDVSTNITGTGSYSNLEVDFSTSTTTKTLTLSNATTITGYLYLTDGSFANGVNLTMANGSTLQLADGVLASSIAGSTGYDVVYDAYTTTSPKTTSNEITGTVRNLTMQTGSGLAINLNRNLVLSGNLTLTSGTLDPTTTNYNITVGGNFSNNASLTSRNNTVSFNGGAAQTISAAASQQFYDLVINNSSGGVQLNIPVQVSHGLTLTNGLVTTSSTNGLILSNGVVITGGSASSYIAGPLTHTLAAFSGSRFFPIGKSNAYRPLTLTLNQNSSTATTYTAEAFPGAPPSRTLPATLTSVSSVRYYNVTSSNNANLASATINISYGADDNVTDPPNLRIAKSSGSNWIDQGGTGSAVGTGTITSTSFSSFSDFVLANAGSVLPLRLISFNASKKNNGVELEWRTAEESNSSYFLVEKLGTQQNWEVIGRVNCLNGSLNSYSFTDAIVLPQAFYRLKMVNSDGSSVYSAIASLRSATQTGIRILQNPTNEGQVNFVVNDGELATANQWKISIIDIYGRVIFNGIRRPEAFTDISAPSLSRGEYVLLIQSGNRLLKAMFIVK